jgi:hypothetical protein
MPKRTSPRMTGSTATSRSWRRIEFLTGLEAVLAPHLGRQYDLAFGGNNCFHTGKMPSYMMHSIGGAFPCVGPVRLARLTDLRRRGCVALHHDLAAGVL